jgi:hypothetical protein
VTRSAVRPRPARWRRCARPLAVAALLIAVTCALWRPGPEPSGLPELLHTAWVGVPPDAQMWEDVARTSDVLVGEADAYARSRPRTRDRERALQVLLGRVARVKPYSGFQGQVGAETGTRLRRVVTALDQVAGRVLGSAELAPVFRAAGLAPPPTDLRIVDWVAVPADPRTGARRFRMGSADDPGWSEPDEQPLHWVTLSPYELARTEVTRRQYAEFDPHHVYRADEFDPHRTVDEADRADLPVVHVSWDDAWLYCRWLDARLPTEAEWEYACRAGSSTRWHHGDDEARLGEYAWAGDDLGRAPRPVATRKANPWGLFDMHGNVWEWCSDWKGPYLPDDVTDPEGPPGGSFRVVRGGSWEFPTRYARSAYRHASYPDWGNVNLGFRPARSLAR